MRLPKRTAVVVAGAALLMSPTVAAAETATVEAVAGDADPGIDITALEVTNGGKRVSAVLTIPGIDAGKLSDVSLQVKPRGGGPRLGAVQRNGQGEVTGEYVSVPTPDGDEFRPCKGIRSSVGEGWMRLSVPKSCLLLSETRVVKMLSSTTWDFEDGFDVTDYSTFVKAG